jgi:predicted DNA-binding transcriptional regulator AlpA
MEQQRLRVLRLRDLASQKGISFGRDYLYRLVRAGKFPQPFKLGEGVNAWMENEIDAWILERAQHRGPTELSKRRSVVAIKARRA